METTLFNHKKLGSTEKPLLKNIQLKQAIARLENGELEIYEKIKQTFTLEATQARILETIYLQQKENNGKKQS
jgi:hypothetical protein